MMTGVWGGLFCIEKVVVVIESSIFEGVTNNRWTMLNRMQQTKNSA